jgi:hypothetical protein
MVIIIIKKIKKKKKGNLIVYSCPAIIFTRLNPQKQSVATNHSGQFHHTSPSPQS